MPPNSTTAKRLQSISKFLSLVLRHRPSVIGIQLDENGWVEIESLLAGAAQHIRSVSRSELEQVVAKNDKQRFIMSDDGCRIRASQGHSVSVDLELVAVTPPKLLFHGTVDKFLDSIRSLGILKGTRHHVHLSNDRSTAMQVGGRRGKPIILSVRALEMHESGVPFYLSANRVWLTDHVPAEAIEFP